MPDRYDDWAMEIDSFLRANPGPQYRDDIMASVTPPIPTVGDFHEAKGRLQEILGGSGSPDNIVGQPDGVGWGWAYYLSGDPVDPGVRRYSISKLRREFTAEFRHYMIWVSMATGISGAVAPGRFARQAARDRYRLLEDIGDIIRNETGTVMAMPPRPPWMP
jgi:hypothetical protein